MKVLFVRYPLTFETRYQSSFKKDANKTKLIKLATRKVPKCIDEPRKLFTDEEYIKETFCLAKTLLNKDMIAECHIT